MDRKNGKQAVNARAGMIAMMQQLARQLQDEGPDAGRLQQENEELVKENAMHKQKIKTLRDRLETLERDASPDAVVARIDRQLRHTGDFDLLRDVFLPAKRKRCTAKARVLTLSDRSSTRASEMDNADRDLGLVLPMQTRSRCSSVGSDRGETSATDAEEESSHAMATRFRTKRRKPMQSPPLQLSPMERKDRKRKAQEIAESPVLVNEAITELATELAKSDALLRFEVSTLKGEVASLQKQLADKTEECVRSQEEVAFLHPDAVIDRVRVKLWHHGDLSLLRKVIDPRPRVLRNTEARSERTLFLCETPTKKASAKAQVGGSQMSVLSPKREGDEETAPLAATSPPLSPAVSPKNINDAVASEEKSEKTTNSPSMSKIDELNNQPKEVVCSGTAA